MSVVIKHADASKLFQDLKSTQYVKWDAERMGDMLSALPAKLESRNGDVSKMLSPLSAKVLDKVTEAVEAGKKIVVKMDVAPAKPIKSIDEDDEEGEEEAPTKKPAKTAKPTKAAKVEKPAKAAKTKKAGKPAKAAKTEKAGKPVKERGPRKQRMDTAQMQIMRLLVKDPTITNEKIEAALAKKGVEPSEWTIVWARQAYNHVVGALTAEGKKIR